MDIQTLLLGILVLGVAVVAWKQWTMRAPGTDDDENALVQRKNEQIGELKKELEAAKSERDKLSGSGKQQYSEIVTLKSKNDALEKECTSLQKQLTKYETSQEQEKKRFDEQIAQLNAVNEALKQERARVQREDETRREEEREAWDRMWTEHEQNVISLVSELCKRSDLQFDFYDNKRLPEGFHGQLKPDCLVGFLQQYVVFDAKVSKSENVQTYINDQVKKTAAKVKGNDQIFQTIFLVIPTPAMAQLKKSHFYEDGFSFYVVSPEAIGPVLSVLKKIESYEFAEQMDPQQRENIVDLIAKFHFHVSTRNAVDYALMQEGLQTLEGMKKVDPELATEALVRKGKMRHLNLMTSDAKAMIENPELLMTELEHLVRPQARISHDDVQSAKKQIR